MKVTLYNAISIDGFIATPDGNSDWVGEADIPFFEEEIEKAPCIVVGRKTFEQFEGDLYPIGGALNIVLSRSTKAANKYDNVIYTGASAEDILKLAEEKGFNEILIVGGGQTNATFLEAGLIDEIIVDVHPIVLGNGIRLFESKEIMLKCEKISLKELEGGLTLIRYKVIK